LSSNSPISRAVDNYVGGTGVNFVNPEVEYVLTGGIEKTENPVPSTPINDGIFLQDIAQSHHFTVELGSGEFERYRTPYGSFSKFLPVKSINLNYTSYENMSIPLAIFGDFPLLNRKRVSTISLACYDIDSNRLENQLRVWESQCFPKGRYVAYMDDIVKKLIYRGYDVKGKETLVKTMYVIPSGAVSVSRDYSANDAKLLNFSLVCVGDGATCATGDGKGFEVPIVDHGGGGNGPGATAFAEVYATGVTPRY